MTVNEGNAVGTDTPYAELIGSADFLVIEGQFQLSVTNLGVTRITECIEWNKNSQDMKAKIEALENVDSVWIERHGDSTLSSSNADREPIDIEFLGGDFSLFLNTPDPEVVNLLFVGDHIKINEESLMNKIYIIQSIDDSSILLNEPVDGILRNAQTVMDSNFISGYFYLD